MPKPSTGDRGRAGPPFFITELISQPAHGALRRRRAGPDSTAPSIKPRHPFALSALAKKRLPSRVCKALRYFVICDEVLFWRSKLCLTVSDRSLRLRIATSTARMTSPLRVARARGPNRHLANLPNIRLVEPRSGSGRYLRFGLRIWRKCASAQRLYRCRVAPGRCQRDRAFPFETSEGTQEDHRPGLVAPRAPPCTSASRNRRWHK
jgi:hypothetical protein